MAPDFPYCLAALGISATSSDDRYEPFLNPRNTHSLGWGPGVDLCFASA
ncbi:hypothetical protein [Streptomyces sp. NBC_01314]|nr:hypothetical protein OG622_41805 [Streptomyces sp. NBC_01314]